MAELANYELIDNVAVVTMDDGKANAFGPDMIAATQGPDPPPAEERRDPPEAGRGAGRDGAAPA